MNPPIPDPDRFSAPPSATAPLAAEARDFEDFAGAQDPLDLAAATWAARRRRGLSAAEDAELAAWLAADPVHAALFDDMQAMLGDVGRLADEAVAALRAGLGAPSAIRPVARAAENGPKNAVDRGATSPAAVRPPAGPAAAGRRAWRFDLTALIPQAAAAAIAFVVLGAGWLGWDTWQAQPTFSHSYATARGQQLDVRLPDGSRLQLDTATRADVRFYRDRREVRLADGQAMFAVHANAGQPFHVLTGDLRVTVVGTRFAIRHTASGSDPGTTRVAVEEGRVRVARAAAGGGDQAELTAGQTVLVEAGGPIGQVAGIAPGSVASWRDGRISFDNTPLAQALAEFERYGDTGLVIRDPAVAALRIGGSFSLQQFASFKRVLPQLLPVRLEPRGDTFEVVGRQP